MQRYAATHAEHLPVRLLTRLGKRLTDMFDVPDHQSLTNGEADILAALGPHAKVILDVGAFAGEWALLAADKCPRAKIHCFEIVTSVRQRLSDAMRDQRQILVEDVGLADVSGQVPVKFYPAAAWVSSLVDYPHNEVAHWHSEPVITGDEWLNRSGYSRIDFVKIDAEGGEKRVLDGFAQAIRLKLIDVIQLEYGRANIVTRWLLRDIHEFFSSHGYLVGRVRPGRVNFSAYTFEHEDFRGPNYVAVRTDLPALVARLAGSY